VSRKGFAGQQNNTLFFKGSKSCLGCPDMRTLPDTSPAGKNYTYSEDTPTPEAEAMDPGCRLSPELRRGMTARSQNERIEEHTGMHVPGPSWVIYYISSWCIWETRFGFLSLARDCQRHVADHGAAEPRKPLAHSCVMPRCRYINLAQKRH
jgi:hypothetical protein